MFRKFEREVIRPAVKKLEKASIKLVLDPERDKARVALRKTEEALAEINTKVEETRARLETATKRKREIQAGVIDTMVVALEKLSLAEASLITANQFLEGLVANQRDN